MTKTQAIEIIETAGAKVLFCRMDHGKPMVTISWRDYLKVRTMPEVAHDIIRVAMR